MKHLIFLLVLLVFSGQAWSATFCVDDSAGLQNALNVAASNGEDDRIRIKSGDCSMIHLTADKDPFWQAT